MLRAPEPNDIDSLYLWENDPERLLHGRTGLPYSRFHIAEYIKNYTETALASGHIRFVIEYNGAPAGITDLYDIDFSARKGFVSIYVAMAFRHKGIATESLRELLEFARDQLGLYQLCAVISTENKASINLFQLCGFGQRALLPQWVRSIKGGFTDALLMSIFL